jgi:FtsH-binding integral membrane protein
MQKMPMTEHINANDDKRVKQKQQQQQQHQQQRKKKNPFRKRQSAKSKSFDLGVLDLLTAIVFCYLTYFVLCIFQKFADFLSNECYFITFLILLLGLVVLQIKQYFRSTK